MTGVPELSTMSIWEFDVFDIPDKRVLMGVMWRFIDALGVGRELGISESALQGFVQDVAVGYRDNPFHNLHHATCVTHFTYMLMHAWDAKKYLNSQQVYSEHTLCSPFSPSPRNHFRTPISSIQHTPYPHFTPTLPSTPPTSHTPSHTPYPPIYLYLRFLLSFYRQ